MVVSCCDGLVRAALEPTSISADADFSKADITVHKSPKGNLYDQSTSHGHQ